MKTFRYFVNSILQWDFVIPLLIINDRYSIAGVKTNSCRNSYTNNDKELLQVATNFLCQNSEIKVTYEKYNRSMLSLCKIKAIEEGLQNMLLTINKLTNFIEITQTRFAEDYEHI